MCDFGGYFQHLTFGGHSRSLMENSGPIFSTHPDNSSLSLTENFLLSLGWSPDPCTHIGPWVLYYHYHTPLILGKPGDPSLPDRFTTQHLSPDGQSWEPLIVSKSKVKCLWSCRHFSNTFQNWEGWRSKPRSFPSEYSQYVDDTGLSLAPG
jgi:hypothetical protein